MMACRGGHAWDGREWVVGAGDGGCCGEEERSEKGGNWRAKDAAQLWWEGSGLEEEKMKGAAVLVDGPRNGGMRAALADAGGRLYKCVFYSNMH